MSEASRSFGITVENRDIQVPDGTRGSDLFASRQEVVVMRIGGELWDLDRSVPEGAVVEPVSLHSAEGLNVLRHSAAHVMAQAVQELYPDARLGTGPYIVDGFYFDFDVEAPFTPDDLQQIEKRMLRIVNADQRFVRRVINAAEAAELMASEPYKLLLLAEKNLHDTGRDEHRNAEVLSVYENVARDGSVVWRDLCRGPHIPRTKLLGNGFALTRVAAAYWQGNENNKQLQRIYGTAWPSKQELREYQERQAEAERRDHRKLGVELDLFSFPEAIGSGLPIFHPKGAMIRKEMEDYSRARHIAAGYEFAYTPHITKSSLYEISGHLDWYRDGMFPAMRVDEERDARGNLVSSGHEYFLKPMNCPMHNLIFAARGRSYRELPLRLFEFGAVYRYEKSGVLQGLTRVRGMTQDDAHIYCTREQMQTEIASALDFVLALLRDYGFEDFSVELSTKDPQKFVGSEEIWEEATRTLAEVAQSSGLDLVQDPGGAAFYGPKISVQIRDSLGRSWQMSTIQLDFNMPERFGLEYQAADGSRRRPVMIHRALFGSVERFLGLLTEHYAGAFPAWLAPVQVRAIPVAETFEEPIQRLVDELRAVGIRAEGDFSSMRFSKKIRVASKERIPFVLIIGGEDAEAGTVSFRFRGGAQDNGVPVPQAVARIQRAVDERWKDPQILADAGVE